MQIRACALGLCCAAGLWSACGEARAPEPAPPARVERPTASAARAQHAERTAGTERTAARRTAPSGAARATSATPSGDPEPRSTRAQDVSDAPGTARAQTLPGAPALHELELDAQALRQTLASSPETRALADGFRAFSTQAIERAAAGARGAREQPPVRAMRPALLWSPPRGSDIVVLSGDTPGGAVLLAYQRPAAGGAHFAGSYETRGEHVPILLGYRPENREELLFSTCWTCGGEGGTLRVDAEAKLHISVR